MKTTENLVYLKSILVDQEEWPHSYKYTVKAETFQNLQNFDVIFTKYSDGIHINIINTQFPTYKSISQITQLK